MLDDRGKEVKILNQTAFEPWPLKGDDRIAKLIVRLGVAVRGENEFARAVIATAYALAFMLLCCLLPSAVRYLGPGGPGWIPFLVVFGALVVLARLQFRFLTGLKSSRLAQTILEEGLCPCCGYNLHGIPAPEDSFVACPECGSAWRSARIKRTAQFAASSVLGNPLWTAHKTSSRQNWTARDAGGRRVGLVHPCLRSLTRAAPPERAAELRAARREIARRSRWARWPVLGIMWTLTAGSAYLIWLGSDDGRWILGALGVLVLGGATLGAVFSNFLYSARATRDVLVRIRFCPSCAADLTAVQSNAEGNLGCPGCLAEWKEAPNHG